MTSGAPVLVERAVPIARVRGEPHLHHRRRLIDATLCCPRLPKGEARKAGAQLLVGAGKAEGGHACGRRGLTSTVRTAGRAASRSQHRGSRQHHSGCWWRSAHPLPCLYTPRRCVGWGTQAFSAPSLPAVGVQRQTRPSPQTVQLLRMARTGRALVWVGAILLYAAPATIAAQYGSFDDELTSMPNVLVRRQPSLSAAVSTYTALRDWLSTLLPIPGVPPLCLFDTLGIRRRQHVSSPPPPDSNGALKGRNTAYPCVTAWGQTIAPGRCRASSTRCLPRMQREGQAPRGLVGHSYATPTHAVAN